MRILAIIISIILDIWNLICGALILFFLLVYLSGTVTLTFKKDVTKGEKVVMPVKEFFSKVIDVDVDAR